MKTKIIIIIIAALISLWGCKSVKQAQKDTILKETGNSTVKQSDVSSNDISLKAESQSKETNINQVSDKGKVAEVITEETKTTNFAPPDSTGRQSITSETSTKKITTRNEQKNLEENSKKKLEGNSQVEFVDQSDSKSDVKLNDQSNAYSSDKEMIVNTVSTPTRIYVAISIAVVLLLGLILYFKSKSFNGFINRIFKK